MRNINFVAFLLILAVTQGCGGGGSGVGNSAGSGGASRETKGEPECMSKWLSRDQLITVLQRARKNTESIQGSAETILERHYPSQIVLELSRILPLPQVERIVDIGLTAMLADKTADFRSFKFLDLDDEHNGALDICASKENL